MLRKLVPWLAVGLMVMAAMPAGQALSHRTVYDGIGVAIQGTTIYALQLHWSGDCTRLYTITLLNSLGQVVSSTTFQGFQEHEHPPESPFQPVELHHIVNGFSTTPGVSFTVLGQVLDTVNYMPHVHIAGVYRGTFQGFQITYLVQPGPWTTCE